MADQDMDKDMRRRAGVREAFSDLAKEMGFAVRDIRSEIIDSAWFDQEISDEKKEAFEFYSTDRLSEKDQDTLGERDFAQEQDELYGRDDLSKDRNIDEDRGREREQEIER